METVKQLWEEPTFPQTLLLYLLASTTYTLKVCVGHNFNHLIKEAAEQEQAQQGVGEVPPVDEPQVEKFTSWRYIYPLFSATFRRVVLAHS